MTLWQRWLLQPQKLWLRRALFQVHLWGGIGLGLYVLVVSVTGSIVVYSNELYRAATPAPIVVTQSGPRLTDDELNAAVHRAYPGFTIENIVGGAKPDQPATVGLEGPSGKKNRLFNPYTGTDIGNAVPLAITLVSKLLELHDDLMGGQTGRRINGFGAVLLLLVAFSGIVVWWPGVRTWRRSLMVRRNVGWQRFTWDLHSMLGFWLLGVVILFALSGAYLGNPEFFQNLADRIQPITDANAGDRLVDSVVYWLAYLHFGRIGGIGIPCHGPGLCDQAVKLTWAIAGLTPAVMFVTGVIVWWNRIVRTKFARKKRSD